MCMCVVVRRFDVCDVVLDFKCTVVDGIVSGCAIFLSRMEIASSVCTHAAPVKIQRHRRRRRHGIRLNTSTPKLEYCVAIHICTYLQIH